MYTLLIAHRRTDHTIKSYNAPSNTVVTAQVFTVRMQFNISCRIENVILIQSTDDLLLASEYFQ